MSVSTAPRPTGAAVSPRFRVRVVQPDLVFFLAEEEARCVRGEGWARLAPLLDGTLDRAGLAARAGLLLEEVEAALRALAAQGLLADGEEAASAERPATPPRSAGAGPAAAPLRVHGAAGGLAPLAVRGTAGSPARAADAPADSTGAAPRPPALHLLAVDDYLDPQLASLARAVPQGGAWLPVKAAGARPWIGPLFGAGGEACPGCLELALARSRPVAALYYRLHAASDRSTEGSTPSRVGERSAAADGVEAGEPRRSVSDERAAWVIEEVRRRLAEESLVDALWVLDPGTGEGTPHRLRREPDCPLCGGGPASPGPLSLRPLAIAHRCDGGFRVEPPAETRRRLEALVDPLTGPVRAVRPRGLAGSGAPCVAVATYPHPLPPATWAELRTRPRVAAAGKGATADQALCGALAEAVERSSAVFRGDEPRRLATYGEIAEEALRPDELLLYSERQLSRGEEAVRPELREDGEATARPWGPDLPTEWTAVHSLADGRRGWMPTALAWHAYRPPPGAWAHRADSNGCAAGSAVEEAVLQGLLELVERDAVALWWYNGLARPRLDPAAEPTSAATEALCRRLGRRLVLLDLTSDLGLPVVAAVALSGDREQRPLFGFGAHLDPSLAIGRAVSELGQFLPGVDGTSMADRRASRHAPAWLLAAAEQATDARLPDARPCDDLARAIALVLEGLAAAGLEAWALELTRRRDPLRVVRVVAPGLRPWTRRLAPGRLYDVPVRMGWRPAPRREDEMERPLYA